MTITIEEFNKVEIKMGKVVSAQKVEGADKLLQLIFDIGTGQIQILSGIATYFPDPSYLVGKVMPVITNIQPRTLRGLESQGMIMAIDTNDGVVLLQPEKDVPLGSIVK